MAKVTDAVAELARPIVEQAGCTLWEGGVDIDCCEAVSRPLSDLLDEADPIQSSYTFEVSSAGLDRVLRLPEHFAACAGQQVDVKLYRPVDGRKEYTGVLAGYEDGDVLVDDRRFEKKDVAQVRFHVTF